MIIFTVHSQGEVPVPTQPSSLCCFQITYRGVFLERLFGVAIDDVMNTFTLQRF